MGNLLDVKSGSLESILYVARYGSLDYMPIFADQFEVEHQMRLNIQRHFCSLIAEERYFTSLTTMADELKTSKA